MNRFLRFISRIRIIAFILISFFPLISLAQLSGVKNIPGDYATIALAITDLNLQGVGTGGVTFNVAAGHTETSSNMVISIGSNPPSASNPIVFQKSGAGANPLITAAPGISSNNDGIITLSGTDFITFDSIDLLDPPSNTGDAMMEWGFALFRASPTDGCQNVVIKNCTITLQKINVVSSTVFSIGIYAAGRDVSGAGITATDPAGQNSYNTFYGNNISNVYKGIVYLSSSTARDVDNRIGVYGEAPNNITNWGGGNQTTEGIRCEGQVNVKISNNIINGGAGSTTFVHGIIATLFGTSANAQNYEISHNRITVAGGSSNLQYVIRALASGDTVRIHNNIIENCTSPSTSNYFLISHEGTSNAVFIYDNIVRDNIKTGATGIMSCIANTSSVVNAEIYNNQIYGNSNTALIHGVNVTGGTRISVFGNKINNISSNSSANTIAVGGITIASGPQNAYVYNNFISDLRAQFSTAVDGVRGVNITSTTTNSIIGVYYNTVYLNSTSSGANFGTSGIFHTFSTTATTAQLDMRNNIVVNLSTQNGTGKTAAFRRSGATNLNNYLTVSNNNSFYAGTPGVNNVIYFDGTNFDQTIEDFKSRVAPRETFSITENVPFVNTTTLPYDLHVRTDVSTQTESGGTPINSPVVITTDIDGDLRNVTTPDIGADEFNGIGLDITPPSIGYAQLDHTLSTANRTLSNVVIVDLSGINVAPGTAPRIYYKRGSDNNTFVDNTPSTNGWKFTQTTSSSSPFEFLIDYSLLFGGTGVQMGDTIQYFVVAQDLADPANVGISEGTFASQPASVNLTAAAFPVTGSINFYRIIILLNGVVTVGNGGNYPNLTGPNGLFTLFNENIVNGNVIAQIVSNINEPGTVALNQWTEQGAGNYRLTIQPNAAENRILSGSVTGGLFRLNGVKRVELDGRFNGSGNYLTFENTNAAVNTTTIQLISLGAGQGSSDITIRNCNIKAGANSLANVFGIFGGSSTGSISTGNAGGADLDNISILENNISKCRTGVFVRGTTSDQMQNLVISGNKIGSDLADEYVTEYGIYVGYADAPQVTLNEVYNMIFEVSKWGIYFTSNVNNARVSKNKIHSIKQTGTLGYNSVGIVFFSATGCFDNTIDNNMIYDLSTYGNVSMYLVGIRIAGGSGYKVYYNSVSIDDTIGNPAAGMVSSCLFISTATTNVDIRNNIFSNVRTGGNDPKNYAIFSPNTTTFANLNNNNYWTSGNFIGYFGSDITTFDAWKTATGQDNDSYNVNPLFASSTDLHISSGLTPTPLESGGAFITGFDTDIDGDIRPGPAGSVNGGATAPDIGADEFDGVPFIIPDTVYVNVLNNFFDPANFTVQVGDIVKWTLVEGMHTTTSTTIPAGAAPWNYEFMGVGDTYTYQVTVAGNYTYECTFHPGMIGTFTAVDVATFQLSVDVANGWNMVAIPGLHPVDQNVNTWWAGKDPAAGVFRFAGGYQAVTTVAPGTGYWMKHVGANTYNTGDEWPAGGIQIVPNDPIPAVTGWNLIGGYHLTVATAGITTTPVGLISGQVFGYTPGSGYAAVTNLVPGYGYWIKLTGAGNINLPSSLAKSAPVSEYIKSDWGRIMLTDAAGKSYILYSVDGEVDLTQYELPPLPPAGMFDVRYGSQRLAEVIGSEIQTIEMQGIEYPVTVRVEGMTIRLQDETGKIVNQVIKSGEDVVISNPQVGKLKVSGNVIPETYSLEQNYPNPFNPSTTIEFSIPEDVENLKLTIYDALGQKVAELVNGKLEAGRYSYQWDASKLASGLYIYQLQTNKFTSTKKMLMLK